MGGRGSGSGRGARGAALASQYNSAGGNNHFANGGGMGFHAGEGNTNPDFTDNGNPALLKWQSQTDDKSAAYLAKLNKQAVPAQDAEGYQYYENAYQKMVIDMDLNKKATVMDKASFDAYVKATGQTPIYRGMSGPAAKDRLLNASKSHTGTGMYGDGYYFGDYQTASGYGGTIIKAALSPSARVVSVDDVRQAIAGSGSKLQSALRKSGRTSSGQFLPNSGESQMALKMGYNVIRTSWSYVALTRDALVIQG